MGPVDWMGQWERQFTGLDVLHGTSGLDVLGWAYFFWTHLDFLQTPVKWGAFNPFPTALKASVLA